MKRKKYELGGMFEEMGVPVEIEGGETLGLPNGKTISAKGPKHEQGGIDISLPVGTMVFSDSIKIGGESLAERKTKRERTLAKALRFSKDNEFDIFNLNTVERTLEKNSFQEMDDVAIQELVGQAEDFKYGGEVTPAKAKKILKDGEVRGNKLTDKQRKFFGAVSKYQLGGIIGGLDGILEMLSQNPANDKFKNDIPGMSEGIPSFQGRMSPLEFLPTTPQPVQSQGPSPLGGLQNILGGITSLGAGAAGQGFDDASGGLGGIAGIAGKVGGSGILGPAGAILGTAAPLITTILNRIGDKKNPNYYDDYGTSALASNNAAMRGAGTGLASTISNNALATNAQQAAARNSASGVNVSRGLQQAATGAEMRANEGATARYVNTISDLFGQRSGMQLNIDKTKADAKMQQFTADQQDRDQFYTNLNSDLRNAAKGLMFMQGQKKGTPDVYSLLGLDFLNQK